MSTTALVAENAGVRLAYEVSGSGPPVLLVQGLGYGRWGWDPAAGPLAERFTVVRFDNRGIGASDVPPGPYTTRMLAEDAAAVLDAAGVGRTHVVGASLGGMVAQELAAGFPERVDRLVLACTTPGGPDAHPMPAQTVELMQAAVTLPPEEALRRFVENALAPGVESRLVDEIYARRLANPPDPAGWQAQAAAGAAFGGAAGIHAPTLVVHGTADVVVDPRNAELLARRIPNARLELFEACGHLLFWEQPGRFVRVIEEFLA